MADSKKPTRGQFRPVHRQINELFARVVDELETALKRLNDTIGERAVWDAIFEWQDIAVATDRGSSPEDRRRAEAKLSLCLLLLRERPAFLDPQPESDAGGTLH